MNASTTNAPVLVAVNGELESLLALDWAIEFATTRGHWLRVVTAIRPTAPLSSDSAGSWRSAYVTAPARHRAQSLALAPLKRSGLPFEHVVAVGPLERVLPRFSRDAALAVVGVRAAHGWRNVLRRSAAKRLTGRLSCPLVSITPPPVRNRATSMPVPTPELIAGPLALTETSATMLGA